MPAVPKTPSLTPAGHAAGRAPGWQTAGSRAQSCRGVKKQGSVRHLSVLETFLQGLSGQACTCLQRASPTCSTASKKWVISYAMQQSASMLALPTLTSAGGRPPLSPSSPGTRSACATPPGKESRKTASRISRHQQTGGNGAPIQAVNDIELESKRKGTAVNPLPA